MKLAGARALIERASGFRVHFEYRQDGLLKSDFFPDRDEAGIMSEEEAWALAAAFADVDPTRYVNIYVIRAWDFVPVPSYLERKFNAYD